MPWHTHNNTHKQGRTDANNDDFSEQVFNNFIDGLDPSKRYFTQEDLKEFSKFKYEIDNQLIADDVSFYNLV